MKSKLFFHGLNELRAIAALAVVFHHIELYKQLMNLNSLFDVSMVKWFIENLGKNGVYLFFVLSWIGLRCLIKSAIIVETLPK